MVNAGGGDRLSSVLNARLNTEKKIHPKMNCKNRKGTSSYPGRCRFVSWEAYFEIVFEVQIYWREPWGPEPRRRKGRSGAERKSWMSGSLSRAPALDVGGVSGSIRETRDSLPLSPHPGGSGVVCVLRRQEKGGREGG